MDTQKSEPKLYVALGASAGGLEALETFFGNTPDDTGFAYIVIQHLSPDHKSLMVELLSKVTGMEVMRAADTMKVEANKVYLIPPKKNLTIFHGKLMLADQKPNRGINFPIDIFFRSLAEDIEEKAVGIILSGTGSDGSQGIKAIKEAGGIVLVQSEDTAKFDGMPRAASASGLVDFILPPSEMPGKLTSIYGHIGDGNEKITDKIRGDEAGMTKVFSLLREKHKVDFTFYKPNTVQRRIQRRMNVNQIDSIDGYVKYLYEYPAELATLYRELLIGVTRFFRNKEVFDELTEKIMPELLSRKSDGEIRFWIAGCSTGEEAYTLAIIVRECLEELKINRDVKIFATDLDRDAIAFAQNGIYNEGIAADIDARLLSKYFYRKDETFRVSRAIREMIVFAQHNIIKDPPFTNIELVSCRNLLIYLQPVLQKKVLEMFTFSLNKGGVLLLGTSETTGELTEYFDQTHQKNRIFRVKDKYNNREFTFSMPSTVNVTRPGVTVTRPRTEMSFGRMGDEIKFTERFMNALVEQFASVVLVINVHLEVLHVVGETQGLFKLPPGRMTSDISKLAIKDLSLPLTTGLQKVFRTKNGVKYNGVPIKFDGSVHKYNVKIELLPDSRTEEPLAMVLLEDITDSGKAAGEKTPQDEYSISQNAEQHIQDLEQELQFTKENLQATIEELETSNEELQATNEELLASNEELQSTNEELQSTNEELHTINAQYQSKIIELTELNNDVENLLTSSHIGKIILDGNMTIRRYSTHILKIFKLLEDDVGRPLTHISHYLVNVDPAEIVKKVIESEQTYESEVETSDGRWYLMRAIPYKIGPEVFSGAVMTFIDISQIKDTQHALQKSEQNLRYAAELTQVATWAYHPGEDRFELSERGYKLFAIDSGKELTLDSVLSCFSASTRKKLKSFISKPKKGKDLDIVAICETCSQDKGNRHVRIIGNALYKGGGIERLAGAVQDVTSMVVTEKELEVEQEKFAHLFENMNQGVIFQDKTGKIISANPAACRLLGLSMDQVLERDSKHPDWKTVHEDESPYDWKEHPSIKALKTGKESHGNIMGVFNPEKKKTTWIEISAIPIFDERKPEEVKEVYTIFDEIKQSK